MGGQLKFSLNYNHTSWLILLMIYNLSMWLCIHRKHMFLFMMILGPRQPRNDINVYPSPLIEDLKVLWDECVDVDDAYSSEKFKIHAILFYTINDFPAYRNLSGYNVKGHKTCPICESNMGSTKFSLKRDCLPWPSEIIKLNNPYHRLREAFNGEREFDIALKPVNGEEVYK